MRVTNLTQGTAEWLRWLASGLGGSDAPAIAGVSPWTTPLVLWQRRTGAAAEEEDDFAMRRGRRLEPIARRLYEASTRILTAPLCGRHERHSWMRVSLDGITLAGDLVLEIKAPNRDAHTLALKGQVPEHYWPQLQHELAVSGAPLLHYVSITENQAFGATKDLPQIAPPVAVRPDPDYIDRLIATEAEFWEMILCRRQPPPDWPAQSAMGRKTA